MENQNLETLNNQISTLKKQIDEISDFNYSLRTNIDSSVNDYIKENFNLDAKVCNDFIIIYTFEDGKEVCTIGHKGSYSISDEQIFNPNNYYISYYSTMVQIDNKFEIERLITIGRIAADLNAIVEKHIESCKKTQENYKLNRKSYTEINKELKDLETKAKELELEEIYKIGVVRTLKEPNKMSNLSSFIKVLKVNEKTVIFEDDIYPKFSLKKSIFERLIKNYIY